MSVRNPVNGVTAQATSSQVFAKKHRLAGFCCKLFDFGTLVWFLSCWRCGLISVDSMFDWLNRADIIRQCNYQHNVQTLDSGLCELRVRVNCLQVLNPHDLCIDPRSMLQR